MREGGVCTIGEALALLLDRLRELQKNSECSKGLLAQVSGEVREKVQEELMETRRQILEIQAIRGDRSP